MSDFFACWKFDLLAIDGGVNSTPTVHTFFPCAFCQRACPSLLSQLSGHIQPHSHALTPRNAWLKESRSTLLVSRSKTVTLHRAMFICYTSLSSSHVLHPPLSEHKPCEDQRPHLSGALAETRPFASPPSTVQVLHNPEPIGLSIWTPTLWSRSRASRSRLPRGACPYSLSLPLCSNAVIVLFPNVLYAGLRRR